MSDRVRAQPCEACPYRRDAPSGLWAADEYDKLPAYDAPTADQPVGAFCCHATPEFLCHGWAVVHSNRGNEFALLALRLRGVFRVPRPAVPLFGSGSEAADHGKRGLARPSRRTVAAAARLIARYPRLRKDQA